MPPAYTDQDLDHLTEEEREALLEDDGGEGPTPTRQMGDAAQDDNDDGDTDGDKAGEGDDGKPADEKGKKEGEGGDPAAAGAAADDDAGAAGDADKGAADVGAKPAAPVQQPQPVLSAVAPENAEQRFAEIATQKSDLATKFDEGELTAKEYQTQLDALNKQERELERAIDKAQLAAEMNQQAERNAWQATVNAFLDANPHYRQHRAAHAALDAEVRALAKTEEAQGWSGEEILAKAHENVVKAFGQPAAAPAPGPAPAPKPKAPPIELPPTLARVPAAEHSETGEGEFAALDRLQNTDPIKYEEQLARMSDAQLERYLASR